MALSKISKSQITDLAADTSNAAVTCNLFYAATRDALLESFPWGFAKQRSADLARLPTAPAFGYTYQYALPNNPKCLRVLKVNGSAIGWRQEGNNLLTDEESIKIQYIAQIDDPNQFSPTFIQLLAERLSAEICYTLTKSRTLEEQRWKIYADKEIEAFSNQSQEGSLDDDDNVDEDSSLIDVRA